MGEVYLIRHGQTAWNREEVFRGRADVPLSELGRRQAEALAERWNGAPPQAIYTSPLSRARETAGPLSKSLGLDVTVEQRLVDMSFGEWEGVPLTEVQERWPELYGTWADAPARFRAPGGEILTEVAERAWAAVDEITERHGGGAVVVVSHRVVCKLVLLMAMGVGERGFWRVRVDTASVSVLERGERGWVVSRVNDVQHLSGVAESDRTDF